MDLPQLAHRREFLEQSAHYLGLRFEDSSLAGDSNPGAIPGEVQARRIDASSEDFA